MVEGFDIAIEGRRIWKFRGFRSSRWVDFPSGGHLGECVSVRAIPTDSGP